MPSGTALRPAVVVSSTMPPGSTPSRRHSPAAERCEIADDGPAHSWAALSFCSHELRGALQPVDAGVNRHERAGTEPVLDRRRANAGLEELVTAQKAQLSGGQRP